MRRVNTHNSLKPVISLKNITYNYGGEPALTDINLKINTGEKIAILGANGSGKSTLLKIIDGLIFPTAGTYHAFGKIIDSSYLNSEQNEYIFRKRIGYVFQDSDVQLFSPTVWDEVSFAPLHMGLDKQEVTNRGERAMRVMGITHLRNRIPYQLSGGEKKRVAIASVLSIQPKVWLFDEPTSGLDARGVSQLIDFIYSESEAGNTMITTTHDLTVLEEIADRVIVLSEEHHIVADTSSHNILSDEQFLVKHNLQHVHAHEHTGRIHQHAHFHIFSHHHKSDNT